MHASHVVIDTRDGHTWWRDGAGELLNLDRAADMAASWNQACRPDKRTYIVCELSAPLQGTAVHPGASPGGR